MRNRFLTVLGTASQVPTASRNHVGFFLSWDAEGLLFDPGEGTQQQLTRAGISVGRITRICITHFHGDHCLGLPGVIQRLSLARVQHPVDIIYPASGQAYLERLIHAAIYAKAVDLRLHPIAGPGQVLAGEGFVLESRPLVHGIDTWGYRFKEPDTRTVVPDLLPADIQGRAVGLLKEQGWIESQGRTVRLEEVSLPRPGQAFALVMDTRPCRAALELADKADLAVIEATYLESESQQARDYRHLTAAQAATIAIEAGVRRLVLAHYSQRYRSVEPFAVEAAAVHPDVLAARDLQVIAVPPRDRQEIWGSRAGR